MQDPSTTNAIDIILQSGFGNQAWDLTLPLDRPVHIIIAKLIKMPELGLRATDDDGNRIPYRVSWIEGDRFLNETETLGNAGVQAGHTLVLSQEARAGALVLAKS